MGKQWKQWQTLFWGAPKSLQPSPEIKRHLLLGRKAMANLDNILKSRHITLRTKVCLVKAMVFPVVMYGCESWTIKKVECRKIDAFELWCWRRLLKSPLDCKEIQPVNPKGNQSRTVIGKTDAGTPALCHLMWRTDWLEKTQMLGKIEGRRRRGPQRRRWLDGITDSMDMSLSSLQELCWTGKPGMLQSMGSQKLDTSDWLNWTGLWLCSAFSLFSSSFYFKKMWLVLSINNYYNDLGIFFLYSF